MSINRVNLTDRPRHRPCTESKTELVFLHFGKAYAGAARR